MSKWRRIGIVVNDTRMNGSGNSRPPSKMMSSGATWRPTCGTKGHVESGVPAQIRTAGIRFPEHEPQAKRVQFFHDALGVPTALAADSS
jgi:hypothetical protein